MTPLHFQHCSNKNANSSFVDGRIRELAQAFDADTTGATAHARFHNNPDHIKVRDFVIVHIAHENHPA